MRKKLIGILICISLLTTIIPLTGAINSNNTQQKREKNQGNIFNIYPLCYVEANGNIAEKEGRQKMWKTFWFRPFQDDRACVSYWHIIFKSDATVTIYDKKNGDVVWQNTGDQRLNILGYFGIYIPSSANDGSLHITIEGRALLAMPRAR
jgi:hypothetical protein